MSRCFTFYPCVKIAVFHNYSTFLIERLQNSTNDQSQSTDDSVEIELENEHSVVQYEESSEDETAASTSTASKKPRSQNIIYHEGESFDSYQQAADSLENRGFKRNTKKKTSDGAKTYFFCEILLECSARCYIFEANCKKNFQIFESKYGHDHNEKLQANPVEPKKAKISDNIQSEVVKLAMKRKMKPKFIIDELSERFPDEAIPTAKQIHYILRKHKEEAQPPLVCVGDLAEWCYSKCVIPDDDDESFVLGYDNSEAGEELFFRFVVSTKNLLKQLSNVENIGVDATYKVNWNGFPMDVVGTVDRNKKFHPMALSCCSNETEIDFRFVLKTIRDAIHTLYKKKFSPRYMVADGAQAIENAYKSLFDGTVIMCFAHVERCCENRAFNSKINKQAILSEIKQIQLSPNTEEFKKATELFLKKWSVKEKDFCDYFNKTWLQSHSNWYEGIASYTPSTNNGLEAFNGIFKCHYTFRERLPMNEFVVVIMDAMTKISSEFTNKERELKDAPEISTEMWKKSVTWAENNEIVRIQAKNTVKKVRLFIQSEKNKESENEREFDMAYINHIKSNEWSSLDEYLSNGYGMFWEVTMHKNNDWNGKSTCTCPVFFKKIVCKHVIGMALRLNLTKCPRNANPTLLGQKLKRGRKALAKKALLIQ